MRISEIPVVLLINRGYCEIQQRLLKDTTARKKTRPRRLLVTAARGVARAAVITPAAHVLALVGRGLRMAVGTDQAHVVELVIQRIAIAVVKLKRRGLRHPLGDAADFAAMPARVEQIVLK